MDMETRGTTVPAAECVLKGVEFRSRVLEREYAQNDRWIAGCQHRFSASVCGGGAARLRPFGPVRRTAAVMLRHGRSTAPTPAGRRRYRSHYRSARLRSLACMARLTFEPRAPVTRRTTP